MNINLIGPDVEVTQVDNGNPLDIVQLFALTEDAEAKVAFMRTLSFEDKIKVWYALYPVNEV